ncbi:MAG: hypothetical protein MMC33_000879 [Icmadophila ericetorum]|nr:hypothetical protein [Icmadophila ericetorum]
MHAVCHPPIPSHSQSNLPFLHRDGALPSKPVFPPSPLNSSRLPISKQVRSSGDVDGENTAQMQKRKRRLELQLITSRLSRPFAIPSAYLVGRTGSRVAVWTRSKIIGTNFLRRAAILNSMRKKGLHARKRDNEQLKSIQAYDAGKNPDLEYIAEEAEEGPRLVIDDISEQERPPQTNTFSVGVSNYDAFDEEGDPYDEDSQDEDENGLIYSNFNDCDSRVTSNDDNEFFAPESFLGRSRLIEKQASEEVVQFATGRRKVPLA